jgi:glycosyltransferase involved in cell wall biosynthesis
LSKTVVHFTDAREFGGAEQMLLSVATGLMRRGWVPILLHHGGSGLSSMLRQADDAGIRTRVVPRMGSWRGWTLLPQFARQLGEEGPAVFHAHLGYTARCRQALWGAVLAGIPAVVATQHCFVDIRSWHFRLRHRALSLAADRYIAVSDDMAKRMRTAMARPGRGLQVIHNGVLLPPLAEGPATERLRSELRGTSNRPVVLTVARLVKNKGHHDLLEAAVHVPGAVFVFAGDGPEDEALRRRAEALGVAPRVRFLGFRSDIRELHAAADIVVLPTLREGFSISILEAMAAAKPVIATQVGGNGEAVVHGETGLLVPPADPSQLASAIRQLLADRPMAERFARAGRARVEAHFSIERMVERTAHLYEQLLATRSSNGRH